LREKPRKAGYLHVEAVEKPPFGADLGAMNGAMAIAPLCFLLLELPGEAYRHG
jgi:hypothetical protein